MSFLVRLADLDTVCSVPFGVLEQDLSDEQCFEWPTVLGKSADSDSNKPVEFRAFDSSATVATLSKKNGLRDTSASGTLVAALKGFAPSSTHHLLGIFIREAQSLTVFAQSENPILESEQE